MAEWKTVEVDPDGGAVELVLSMETPQQFGGRVWRYTDAKDPDGLVDQFDGLSETAMELGGPDAVIDKRYLIMGWVVHQEDDPPTPYRLVVSLNQDGQELLEPTVPSDQGEGQIGDANVGFTYHLVLRGQS
jgi:hypothetical protein